MPLPGIILGDCGKKIGMDGVDNGFMLFNQVRIPKDNLLNRFSNVTEAGEFQTLIENPDHRFGMQLGALGTGRILVLLSSASFLETCLRIAVRFAAMR
jgi:acyl-CoA oxidase